MGDISLETYMQTDMELAQGLYEIFGRRGNALGNALGTAGWMLD